MGLLQRLLIVLRQGKKKHYEKSSCILFIAGNSDGNRIVP
jgi:hypothetical protein